MSKEYRVECSEINYFTVLVEANSEDEARELAHANINNYDIETECTSEWSIETVEEA